MRSPSVALCLAPSLLVLACSSEPGDTASVTTTSASTGGGGSAGAGTAGGETTAPSTGGTAGAGGSGGTTTTTTTTTTGNNGFPDHWIDGLSCGSEPEVMVWSYDDDTFILRQSLCTNFEGPFVYLLFGDEKVFLQDTGTGHADIEGAVSGVIAEWLAKKGKASIDLVVTHSHGHGDHVGGDGQFAGNPNTTVVGPSVGDVQAFFGIGSWPTQLVTFDLGGRILDVIPIPGHQNAHVAVYDESRGLLLTGDTLYPGRLYINNWTAYGQSLQRLADFVATPDHPVEWVLGTHIEMTTTPGQDYPFGADQHANEHVLQLTKDTLLELHQAVVDLGNNPQYQEHADFIIYP